MFYAFMVSCIDTPIEFYYPRLVLGLDEAQLSSVFIAGIRTFLDWMKELASIKLEKVMTEKLQLSVASNNNIVVVIFSDSDDPRAVRVAKKFAKIMGDKKDDANCFDVSHYQKLFEKELEELRKLVDEG